MVFFVFQFYLMNHVVTGLLQVQSEADVVQGLVMVSVWQLSVFQYDFCTLKVTAMWCGVYNLTVHHLCYLNNSATSFTAKFRSTVSYGSGNNNNYCCFVFTQEGTTWILFQCVTHHPGEMVRLTLGGMMMMRNLILDLVKIVLFCKHFTHGFT